MFKYHLSQTTNVAFDKISGIDILLIKLEYNALSQEGRVASDYGVPSNIVEYYENPDSSERIKSRFDNYEREIFNRIDRIISKPD